MERRSAATSSGKEFQTDNMNSEKMLPTIDMRLWNVQLESMSVSGTIGNNI